MGAPQQATDVWIKDEGEFAFVGAYTDRGLVWLRSQPTAQWHDADRVVINGSSQIALAGMAERAGLRVQLT